MTDFALVLEQIPAAVWWTLLAIVGVAVLAVVNRPRQKPKPTSGADPAPVTVIAAPPSAPKFLGFLFLNPYYQRGERITLNTGPEAHDCDTSKQTHGILDNGSGPYAVKLRAWDKASGVPVPVYGYDGGRKCDGEWVESGFFDVYALSQRSYSAVGSLVNCNEFVPLYDDAPAMLAKSCGASPCPVTSPDAQVPTSGLVPMVIELQIRNRFGIVDAPWRSEVLVQLSTRSGGGG